MTERAPSLLAAMAQRVLQRHGIAKVDHSPVAPTKREREDAFDAWFANSKVRDAQSAALPVYHGTASDVDAFHGKVTWVSATRDLANAYAVGKGSAADGGANILPLYASIQNPLDLGPVGNHRTLQALREQVGFDFAQPGALADLPAEHLHPIYRVVNTPEFIDAAIAAGYDGLFGYEAGRKAWGAFSPTALKSAIGNRGTYDPTNPDVRFSRTSATCLDATETLTARERDSNFRAWFRDSKAVDAGKPMVLYHGSMRSFDAFDPARFGRTDHGTVGHGIYASANPEVASAYAKLYIAGGYFHEGGNVLPLHMAIQNPINFDDAMAVKQALIGRLRAQGVSDAEIEHSIGRRLTEQLSAMGHDGVSPTRGEWPGVGDSWTAFRPEQVKSIFNTGSYDTANPDIRFSRTHAAAWSMPAPAMPFAFGARHAAPMDEATLSTRLAACGDTIDAEALADEYAQAHERYLHGECHVLALALHARTQAPLWAAIETRGERAGCLIHAFVETDAGVIDLLGLRSRAAMLQEFDVWEPAFEPIDPEALAQLASAMPLSELAPELRAAQDVATAVLRIADTQRRLAAQAAFDVWFHDSKAVTAEGRPLVAYHGTASDFTAFDPVAEGIEGIYFSSSPEIAGEYANWRGTADGGASIYPVHLSIRNPLEVTDLRSFEAHEFQMRIYDAQEAGHDGVVFRDVRDGWDSQTRADTWVAFHPTQIKSVFNAGTYAPGDPDIRFARDRARALPPADPSPVLPAHTIDRDSYEP